jgi:hypothetical protein
VLRLRRSTCTVAPQRQRPVGAGQRTDAGRQISLIPLGVDAVPRENVSFGPGRQLDRSGIVYRQPGQTIKIPLDKQAPPLQPNCQLFELTLSSQAVL